MFTQKVCHWGNALGVQLPPAIAQQIGLEAGALVSIAIEGNKIILSPTKPRHQLDDLLQAADSTIQHPEVMWGAPTGEENW